ncbi:hypothetical protein [Acinetobacter phage vB_AbaSi_W9]|nr:hypothetical protein [Acinetobacter phage vB_AbaSi_W9]
MRVNPYFIPCVVLCVLFGFGLVGRMDYDDEQKAITAYCEGVDQHIHPDYDQKYSKVCIDK